MDGSTLPAAVATVIASPMFQGFAVALAAILAVIALRCTTRIQRRSAPRGSLSPAEATELRSAPDAVLSIRPSEDDPVVIAAVSGILLRQGMRVRSGPGIVQGEAWPWGAWIGPVLLWTLALWVLVIAIAGATRSEGTLGLLQGETVPDTPAAYRTVVSGYLANNDRAGIWIRANEIVTGSSPSALVTILEDGNVMESRRIAPGRALRQGITTVRLRDVALAPIYSVEATGGAQLNRVPFLLPYSSAEGTTTVAEEFSLVDGSGKALFGIRVSVSLESDSEGAAIRQVPLAAESIIQTAPIGTEAFGAPITLKLGERIPLPDGQWLRFVSVDDWVLVTVTHDPVPPFAWPLAAVVAVLAILAVLIAPRRVLVGLVGSDDDRAAHVITSHGRGDSTFGARVRAEIAEALRDISCSEGGAPAHDEAQD